MNANHDPVRETLGRYPRPEIPPHFAARLMRRLPEPRERLLPHPLLIVYWSLFGAVTLYAFRDAAWMPWVIAMTLPAAFAVMLAHTPVRK